MTINKAAQYVIKLHNIFCCKPSSGLRAEFGICMSIRYLNRIQITPDCASEDIHPAMMVTKRGIMILPDEDWANELIVEI